MEIEDPRPDLGSGERDSQLYKQPYVAPKLTRLTIEDARALIASGSLNPEDSERILKVLQASKVDPSKNG